MVWKLLVCAVVFGVIAPAFADWMPGDPHKMHYPQLPDPDGWDVNATFPKVLADDWMCSGTGWVKDIHFWGSWREDLVGPIDNIHLSVHADIPAGVGGVPYSRPGDLLWEWDTGPDGFVIGQMGTGDQGWYDPNTGFWHRPDHFMFWQYNVFLPEPEWYWQEEGTIYWLDISVSAPDPQTRWGWKTSLDHWNDDAVWGDFPDPQWQELRDPITGESLDMAFVITPAPGTLALLAVGGLGLLGSRRRR